MATKFYNRKKQYSNYALLMLEMKLLKQNYDFIKCHVSNGVLVCNGIYTQTGIKYEYRIVYNGIVPKVYIISPKIEYKRHIYRDGSLCLYYHLETPWRSGKMHLYDTIIPWTHEWILFYEIYRQTGKWFHREVVHINGKDKIVNNRLYLRTRTH